MDTARKDLDTVSEEAQKQVQSSDIRDVQRLPVVGLAVSGTPQVEYSHQ